MKMIWQIKRFAAVLFLGILAAASRGQEKAPLEAPDVQREVKGIVSSWEKEMGVFEDAEVYSAQIKKLAEIGAPATRELIVALDHATQDVPLRLIPFAMRAIGDARAVPALIRAIPRTLQAPGSDCGVTLEDRDVLAFMRANDLSAAEGRSDGGRGLFDMGRPVREVAGALHKITGAKLNEEEIFGCFLRGGETQRAIQRRTFQEVAGNWAGWWGDNWKRFVSDPSFAEVGLPALREEAPTTEGAPNKASSVASGWVLSPVSGTKSCAMNLPLDRKLDLPAELWSVRSTDRLPEVVEWAKRSGMDLLGDEYVDPDSGKSFYCLRGLGLQAWEVGQDDWKKIEETVAQGSLPPTNKPARELLMHYDEAKGSYAPEKKAVFHFLTKDGVRGILRTTAQVTRTGAPTGLPMLSNPDENGVDQPDQRVTSGFAKGAQFEFRFLYHETDEMKREEAVRVAARANRESTAHERKMAKLAAKYPKISGTVRATSGELLAGAEVLLAIPGEGAVLGDGKFEYATRSTMVETDEQGKFELPRPPKAHHLYVAHANGFAEVNMAGTEWPMEIQLAPWGRIEGTIVRQGKPAAGEKVALMKGFGRAGEGLTLSHTVFTAVSDEAGRFVFDRLPPGDVQVFRMVKNGLFEGKVAEVIAGKTTVFEHGFIGRNLTGRLVASDGSAPHWSGGRRYQFSSKPPPSVGVVRPGLRLNFPVMVSANGEFQIENVPAGTYEFRATLVEGGEDEVFSGGRILGTATKEIVVPDSNGVDEGAVSVGEIVVTMAKANGQQ